MRCYHSSLSLPINEGIPSSEIFADWDLLFSDVWSLEMSQETPHGFFAIARPEETDCSSEEGSWHKGYAKKDSCSLGRDLVQGQKVSHEYSCAFG